MLEEHRIARWVDTRDDRPNDFPPITHVDVFVRDNDEFGISELSQVGPLLVREFLAPPNYRLSIPA